eukprot:Platyproteum_vivax@DN16595_c0_g1_i1.p1
MQPLVGTRQGKSALRVPFVFICGCCVLSLSGSFFLWYLLTFYADYSIGPVKQAVSFRNDVVLPVAHTSFNLTACNNDLTCIAPIAAETTTATSSAAKTVAITLLDDDYMAFFANMVVSARKAGVNNLLTVSLSESTHQLLTNLGYASYRYKLADSDVSSKASTFLSVDWKRKNSARIPVIYEILRLGYNVLMLDVDLVFIENPYHLFTCKDCDFEIQKEHPQPLNNKSSCEECNMGIIFMRPTETMFQVLEEMMDEFAQDTSGEIWDQWLFRQKVNNKLNNNSITMKYLDFEQFPTGSEINCNEFFDGIVKVWNYADNRTMLHLAHFAGVETKRYMLREAGLWFVDDPKYYKAEDTQYLTYEDTHDLKNFGIVAYSQQEQLLTAIRIATALDRILILPKFTFSRLNKKAWCTLHCLYMHEKSELFLRQYEKKLRPQSFFSSPDVPTSVLQSITDPIEIVQESDFDKQLWTTPRYLGLDLVKAVLKPYNEHSIIKLKNVMFRIH